MRAGAIPVKCIGMNRLTTWRGEMWREEYEFGDWNMYISLLSIATPCVPPINALLVRRKCHVNQEESCISATPPFPTCFNFFIVSLEP